MDRLACSREINRISVSLIALALLLGSGFLFVTSAGRDDTHIYFYHVLELIRTGKFLDYNGVTVQQGTSFLFVTLLAFFKIVTDLPLITIAKAISIVSGSLAVLYLGMSDRQNRSGWWLAPLLLALSSKYMYWIFGGMENTVTAFAALFLFVQIMKSHSDPAETRSRGVKLAAGASLFVLVRPESYFVLITFLVLYCVHEKKIGKACRLVLLSGSVVFFFQTILSYLYTGYVFPLPVHAKAPGLSLDRARDGLRYFFNQTLEDPVLLFFFCLLAFGYLQSFRRHDPSPIENRVVAGALFVFSYSLFIVLSGGDWMEGGRFLVPMLPIAFLSGVAVLGNLGSKIPVFWGLIFLATLQQLWFVKNKSTGMPLWQALKVYRGDVISTEKLGPYSWFEVGSRINLRDIQFLEEVRPILKPYLQQRRSVLSVQMGMVIYYLKKEFGDRLEVFDMRGLATDHLHKCELTKGLKRFRGGIAFWYSNLFDWEADLSKICGIERPFFIFDLDETGGDLERFIQSQGYQIVYRQTGTIGSGAAVLSDMFLAIDATGSEPLPTKEFRWPSP